jgi:plasmid maintenance system killer protein
VAKDMYNFMTMRVKGTWVLVMYYDGKGEHCCERSQEQITISISYCTHMYSVELSH